MKKLSLFLVFAFVTFLTFGCAETQNALSKKSVQGGLLGAAVGAGAGAIIGSQTGHAGVGTAIGAGVGALAGGLIGHAMDKQQDELKQVVDRQNAQQQQMEQMKGEMAAQSTKVADLQRKGDDILINYRGDALFDTGSPILHTGAVNNLKEVAVILKKYPDTRVTIKGHTDTTGSLELNNNLSKQRAEAVKTVLVGEGIVNERITTIGYGPSLPVASNDTPEGRQQNRRVEIEIKANEQQKQG
ncbi:MAG: hypothetical protein A2149_03045 [Candidatus Schekmanbacteria bacterium RBG_16_38_11]|uniref:OmpA-like domain-containing protein n=1 Tax=Candidatus Schekmanbacteria bacterium RBG_16_38_11 TaxID=1817880 RepID=A0A1F7RU33_9BACT|nr:MAG: hypothetical protein A2149_03045 [Candidatus Schekmanbacteria bacterium RBG_16_38_11]